ncbi:TRAP-type C4-dicarboxylate transport system substrate-binding protein [Salsuginibacillus halophilus]|uniref:TRAP-type C4-dicarboxylate transport system substrate-binding protein n=1 Tax=Salsuginibacillus halophilus TaxID=517424 RepID=A0A2P8HQJ5_9BACI|nr:TRAP-type C4-dicarboxylate transport system substrate-binding protein [Salsuginibacillus halophilus]
MKTFDKKWSYAVVLSAAMFSLTACGGDTDVEGETSGGENEGGEAGEFSYDFSHMFPSSHVMETDVVTPFIEDVNEATNGGVDITSYPGAQLAEPDAQYEAAATSVADMGFSVHSYTPGQFPLTSVMEQPFMASTGAEGSDILWDLYEEFPEIQAEYDDVEVLWIGTSEPGQIYTVDQQVTSVEDLEGMRMRSPSPEVNKWLEAAGATPVTMSMNETYEALERGTVDGTVGPYHTLLDYSLQEVIDYVTVGDFYMTTFFAVMNQGAWDEMDEETQGQVEDVAKREMSVHLGEMMDERGEEAIEAAEEAGAEFYELDEADQEEWEEYLLTGVEEWIKEREAEGLPAQEVYDYAESLGDE